MLKYNPASLSLSLEIMILNRPSTSTKISSSSSWDMVASVIIPLVGLIVLTRHSTKKTFSRVPEVTNEELMLVILSTSII